MQFSVVWVSQEITQKIGLNKIKNYLKDFDYGNQDFSGDKERNNGLTEAWLKVAKNFTRRTNSIPA